MSSKNSNLHQAKRAKSDEFYTQLEDIKAEVTHYRHHFRNKTVYLNCDDPAVSQFWRYFADRFTQLGLRRLIATHYVPGGTGTVTELSGSGARVAPLQGDGDFRSDECVALLEQADVVVTNPPFSLFREYIAQLVEHDKRFLVIGNMNAVTYKEVWPHIQGGRLWLGTRIGDMSFCVPDDSEPRVTRFWVDEAGQKWRSLGNAAWFTNLEHDRRRQLLSLTRSYYNDPSLYPTYDNYEAIEVSRVAHIPCDWDGVMGVPITFLDKHNPDQFEIMGIANSARSIGYPLRTLIDGRRIYNRILIRHLQHS